MHTQDACTHDFELPTKEVSQLTGYSLPTIYKMAQEGKLHARRFSRGLRFSRVSVEELMHKLREGEEYTRRTRSSHE